MSAPPRRSWVPWAVLMTPVALLLVVLLGGLVRHDQAAGITETLDHGGTPPAPGVSMQAFVGPPVALSSLRGHAVVLDFWASWCIPCRTEAPQLETLWREFRSRGLVVVGVDTQDMVAPARTFVTRYGLTFPVLRDPDGAVARRFGATGVPETFFIGADGRILGKFPGEEDSPARWLAAAAALIDGRALPQ